MIAAQFCKALDIYTQVEDDSDVGLIDRGVATAKRNAVVDLALSLAQRLQLDNSEFDPVIFLTKCSPDPEQYPLAELWEGVNEAEYVDG